MPDVAERVRGLSVAACPRCGGRHDFALLIKGPTAGTLVFGGATSSIEIGLSCPVDGAPFTSQLELANNEEFVGLANTAGDVEVKAPPEAADFGDWIKTSRAAALDFAKTMMTASSAAIPVYFAVLKYLGSEKLADSPLGRVSVLPPVLFLLAVAIFAVALRPRLAEVSATDFADFRAQRLRRLDRFVTGGLIAFVSALFLSLVVFAFVV
jgi:hypothetical protein